MEADSTGTYSWCGTAGSLTSMFPDFISLGLADLVNHDAQYIDQCILAKVITSLAHHSSVGRASDCSTDNQKSECPWFDSEWWEKSAKLKWMWKHFFLLLVSVFPGDSADGAGDFQRALAVLAAIFCKWVEQVRMWRGWLSQPEPAAAEFSVLHTVTVMAYPGHWQPCLQPWPGPTHWHPDRSRVLITSNLKPRTAYSIIFTSLAYFGTWPSSTASERLVLPISSCCFGLLSPNHLSHS